ncbi:hypothetical protein TWF281_007520 [Arthrobotrys megalospora]
MQSLIRLLPLLAAVNALVPAPRPISVADLESAKEVDPRGLGTSAEIYVYNHWSQPLTVTGTDNQHMNISPPASFKVGPNSVSQKYAIEANGWVPVQSSFKLNLKPEGGSQSTVNVDIGVAPWKTGFSLNSKNPAGQVGVLLAPAKILEAGRDFDFHFFSGPGSFTSFVQSQIDQKLPEGLAKVKGKKFVIEKDIEITVNDIVKPVVKATYVNLGNGPNGLLVDAIANVDGEAQLTITFKGVTQKTNIKVKGLSALITADAKLGASIELDVKRFQGSVDAIDISGDILIDVIGVLYPILAPVLKLPYKLASIVNTSENAKVVAYINTAIKAFASGNSPIIKLGQEARRVVA